MKSKSNTPGRKIEITIPEEKRLWQKEILEGMAGKRFSVVVAHRRAGKTEAVCARLIIAAMQMGRRHPKGLFGYVAPFLNQAKAVAWDRLRYYAEKTPQVKISENELSITLFNGAAIRLFGADYPDRLRGLGFDGAVMDEVAQMRPETWPAVIRPALADRGGWAVFIGTPKGRNTFYDLHQMAVRNPDQWYAGHFPVDKTQVVEASELENLKKEMGEILFRQEFLCDFGAETHNAFLSFDLVESAFREKISSPDNRAPLVFGFDPARFGNDSSALIGRQGLEIKFIETWRKADLMESAGRLAKAIAEMKPRAVFIDSVGLGGGVVDRLKQLGHKAIGVNSGQRAIRPERYVNLKAEMWDALKEWLMEGGTLLEHQRLRGDLLAPTYSFDHAGRLKIESKDDLRARGLPSTDCGDALALTFAAPVAAQGLSKNRAKVAEGLE